MVVNHSHWCIYGTFGFFRKKGKVVRVHGIHLESEGLGIPIDYYA